MRTVLVTAASGNVGRNCVNSLLAKGVRVVATARAPATLALPSEVEVRAYDANATNDFDALFAGISDLVLIGPPLDGRVQDKLAPIIKEAGARKLNQLVYVSGNYLAGVTGKSYEALAIRQVELLVIASGLRHTLVRAGFFMDNYITGFYAPMVNAGQLTLATGDGKSALVAGKDVGDFVAEALVQGVEGEYLVTGPESFDHFEVAQLLTEKLGRPVVYTPISEQQLASAYRSRNLPEESIEYGLTLYRAYRNHATAAITDGFKQVTGRDPMSFRAFLGI
jgi:uncharacterized protein YbjT (DUF2867 family)